MKWWISSEIALIGITATIVLAIVSALTTYMAAKRERRRTLLQRSCWWAILAWEELLDSVARRATEVTRDFVSTFHHIQEKLTFYQEWIGSESKLCTSRS